MIDIIETILKNIPRGGSIALGLSAILLSKAPVPGTYGYLTFLMMAAFMVIWGLSDWRVVEKP